MSEKKKSFEKKTKGLFSEFRKFIARGNVIDMAIGVIVGGAFSAIVTALTGNIFQPLINWALSAGGGDKALEAARTILKGVYDQDGNIVWASSIYIDWGNVITAIINFLLIALILFLILKLINTIRDKQAEWFLKQREKYLKKHPDEVVPAPAPKEPSDHEILKEMLAVMKEQKEKENK